MTPVADVSQIVADIVAIRHDLHEHPELGYQEVRTSQIVQDELAKLGIAFKGRLAGGTGVLGFLPATSPGGKTVALRADMDCLPMTEETGLPYASKTPGKMHACGHDGHTAILLGVAKALSEMDRPNNVLLIFQPAEEGGAGGNRMCQDGCLDGSHFPKADAIYGLHGWPELEIGKMATRVGPLMAATDSLKINVRGKGCHAAYPHFGRDPIVATSQIVSGLQTVCARTTSPLDSVVLSITTIHGGTAHNIIPDEVELTGTLRTLKESVRAASKERVNQVVKGIAEASGVSADIEWSDGYPVTENEPRATERWFRLANQAFGEDNVLVRDEPTMGGEDFSFYGHHVPACFFFLGLKKSGATTSVNVHTTGFDFNDDAIPLGVQAMCLMAQSPLEL